MPTGFSISVSVRINCLACNRDGCPHAVPPEIELAQRQFALEPVAFFAVAHFFGQRREQIEGDVGGLKILGFGLQSCSCISDPKAVARGGAIASAPVPAPRRARPASNPVAIDST